VTELRVYTPDSPLRHPRQFVAAIAGDLRGARLLARQLARRDIAALYRQTAFGYVWAVIPPVATTLVWVLLNSSTLISVKTGSVPYPVYALSGSIFWFLFLDALNAPLKQLSLNKSMLTRVSFPTEALLISGIWQVLFSFAVKLVILAVALLAYQVSIQWTAIFLVFPILAILGVGTVVGVILAPVGMLYKDVEQTLLVIVSPLMFLTPVVYPTPTAGLIGTITRLNPLTPLFTVMRELLYGGVGPSIGAFGAVFAVTLLVALFGWVLYRLALPILVERMDA
jgi:lipopolysaccharide transport system permease protein